jgi:hypothetical protein
MGTFRHNVSKFTAVLALGRLAGDWPLAGWPFWPAKMAKIFNKILPAKMAKFLIKNLKFMNY